MISNDGVLNYDIFPSGVSLYLAMTFGFSPYLAVSLAKKKKRKHYKYTHRNFPHWIFRNEPFSHPAL